ncbi:polyprenyl synthetase family protein [Chloroflexus sp.]|uniref:polyprenyl synthetase family protein n=1 Tax=Chloroflexus sp. TaxID=1904827 RepID=UPI00260177FE|nr:polyprenyl synthetase family protein [uncultured Chloroflexus sp.]
MAGYQPQLNPSGPVTVPETRVVTNGYHVTGELPPQTAGGLAGIFHRAGILADLGAIEQRLLERTASRVAVISAAGAHTVRSGGKRLRAALAVLAAHLGQYQLERVLHPAAAAELIHAASLVHDDLVDQANRRRGQITVHARWDNDVALMVGDYFFALAAAEMALSPDPRIITFYAEAVQTICEGELSPVTVAEPFDRALNQYLYKTGAKTAVLFEAACKAGMVAGGGNDEQVAALGRYGYDLGMAFQIVDDVLDFIGDERTMGKPAGNDLRQGTITLPLIYATAASPSPRLRDVLQETPPDETLVAAVIREVIDLGGVAAAQAEAERYIERAIAHLDIFPPSSAHQALVEIARFVIERAV